MKSKALIRSAAVTVAWVAFATVLSELSTAFKGLLGTIGGHHWIGKSVTSLVIFCLLYLLLSKLTDDDFSLRDTWWLIGTVVLSGLTILVFYIMHA